MSNQKLNFALLNGRVAFLMKLSISIWSISFALAGAAVPSSVWGDSRPIVLEKVVCEGNVQTSCDYLIEQSSLHIDQTLEDEAVQTAKYRLQLLGNFEEVDLRLAKGSEIGKVELTIAVKETSTYSASISALFANPWRNFYGLLDTTLVDRSLTGNNDPLSMRMRLNRSENPYGLGLHGSYSSALLRLEYTKPFTGLPRMFLTAGASGILTFTQILDSPYSSLGNGLYQNKTVSTDLALGYRIFDYSYLMAGVTLGKSWFNYPDSYGEYYWFRESSVGSKNFKGFFVQYGWDSQDDSNFPTTGSKFQLSISPVYWTGQSAWDDYSTISSSLAYRKHFQLADAHILTLGLGQFHSNDRQLINGYDSILGVKYSHYFKRHATNQSIKNASVYFEPGIFSGYFDPYGTLNTIGNYIFGAKAGVSLETSLGMVNLALIAGAQK